MYNCWAPFMNWENKDTPYSFIGAYVSANFVAHYFIVIIQSRGIHIGMMNLKHNHIAAFIHILANLFYGLHRTAELNINMSIEPFDSPNGPPCVLLVLFTYTRTQIDEIVVLNDEKRYSDNVFVYLLQKHRVLTGT